MSAAFPPAQPGVYYLTEGGLETELMYKYGFELPEFAMFRLLDDADAVARLQAMYRAYLGAGTHIDRESYAGAPAVS